MNNDNDILGFSLIDLLKKIDFGIDTLSFLKNKDLQRIKEIIHNPNLIPYLYFNDFYLSYPKYDHSVIIKKLEIIEKLCENRHLFVNNDLEKNHVFFELIKNKKNSDDKITLDDFSILGLGVSEKFLPCLMSDILLYDEQITYKKFLLNDDFICDAMEKYIRYQLLEKKIKKEFYLYELNIVFNQLQKSVKDNILSTLKGDKLSVFADEDTFENYFRKKNNKLIDFIYKNESIYNYVNYDDLDKLSYLLPDYVYFLIFKEEKILFKNQNTIFYIFEIIKNNLNLLNEEIVYQFNYSKK